MMKKALIVCSIIAAVSFSGCSKRLPVSLPPVGTPIGNSGVDMDSGNSGIVGDGVNSSGDIISADENKKNSFKSGAVSSNGKYLGSDGVSKSGVKIVYFASDAYSLDNDQVQRLMSSFPKIKELAASGTLLVEGNCDEFGTDEYNHALGLKRAKSVKKLLVSSGINSQKIKTVSYGESNPICTINKPACHAKNRRVEINQN